jgi:hypothetical protein
MSFSLSAPTLGMIACSDSLGKPMKDKIYSEMLSVCKGSYINDTKLSAQQLQLPSGSTMRTDVIKTTLVPRQPPSAYDPLFTASSMVTHEPSEYCLCGLALVDGGDTIMRGVRMHVSSCEDASETDGAVVIDRSILSCVLDIVSTANLQAVGRSYGVDSVVPDASASRLLQLFALPEMCLTPAAVFVAHAMHVCNGIHSQWHLRISRALLFQSTLKSRRTVKAVTEVDIVGAISDRGNDSSMPTQVEYEQLLRELSTKTANSCGYNDNGNSREEVDDTCSAEIPTRLSLPVATAMYQYFVLGRGVPDWELSSNVLKQMLPTVDAGAGSKQKCADDVILLRKMLNLCGYEWSVRVYNKRRFVSVIPSNSGTCAKIPDSSDQKNNTVVDRIRDLHSLFGSSQNVISEDDVVEILMYILVTSLRSQWKPFRTAEQVPTANRGGGSTSRVSGNFPTIDGTPRSSRSVLRSADASNFPKKAGRDEMVKPISGLRVMERHDISSLRELAAHVVRNHVGDSELAKHTGSMTLFEYQQFLKLRQQAIDDEAKELMEREQEEKKLEDLRKAQYKDKHTTFDDVARRTFENPVDVGTADADIWMPESDIRRMSDSELATISLSSYSFILQLLEHHIEQARARVFVLGLNKLYRSVDPQLTGIVTLQRFTEFVHIYAHQYVPHLTVQEIYYLSVRSMIETEATKNSRSDFSSWQSLLKRIFELDSDADEDVGVDYMTFQTFVYSLLHMILIDLIDPKCLQPWSR